MTSGLTIDRRRVLVALAAAAGALLMLSAGAWWWVVFRPVVLAGYLSVPRALPCLVSGSIRCTLAEALCNGQHLLGIRRYDAATFWIGLVAAVAGVVLSQSAPVNWNSDVGKSP